MFAFQSMAGGPNISQVRRLSVALLLAGAAVPASAVNTSASADAASTADAATAAQPAPPDQRGRDITVIGRPFLDVQPEHQLDQQAIESYGVSTVGDLLDEVQNDLNDDMQPLVFVNGEIVSDPNEVTGFPVEALKSVQVLPRGSAIRVGGFTGQRVINLTLVRKMRSATATAAEKVATDGHWHSERGEGLLTYIHNQTRGNVALRVRDESSLLESQRGVVQPTLFTPFALRGNVVGFPDTAGEIDPFLSALAGRIVTVAPVPTTSSPTLSSFVPDANNAATADIGRFRTLRPDLRNYDLNATFSTRLAPWLTGTINFRYNRGVSHSLRGLPSALFVLSPANAASPFSRDVGLAFYGQDPLRSRSITEGSDGRVTLNGRFGKWVSNFNASHTESTNSYGTDRQTGFGTIALGDSMNPFATDLTNLIGLTTDRSSFRTITDLAQLSLIGPIAQLPAGPVQTTVEGRLAWNRLKSRSTFFGIGNTNFRRDEQAIRGAVDVPLTSRSANVLPQVGDLDFTAEYARAHFSDAGSLNRSSFGLNWSPLDALQLRGSLEQADNAPSMQALGSSIIETPLVRVFDPLTGETVDVTQITGGNPNLRPQKIQARRISALLRLVPKLNLQLNAEYSDTNARNFISALPPASLPVMLAFPDRYIRDSNGNLTTIDLRPINFDSHREKRLQWGFSMRAKLLKGNILGPAPGAPPESEAGEEGSAPPAATASQGRTPSTYLQLNLNHTIVFSDRLAIRSGLNTVDLLSGGALGIGGGRVRHQLDGTASLTSGGLGARLGVTWRGASSLDTSINGISDTVRFSPVLLMNLRLFADARRFAPDAGWAKGLRFSADVVNVCNERQKVRDSLSNTPLQYQPAYRDPLGRTIEFEIRKVF